MVRRYTEYADGTYHAEFFGVVKDKQWESNDYSELSLNLIQKRLDSANMAEPYK
jgi:hypothetical protein